MRTTQGAPGTEGTTDQPVHAEHRRVRIVDEIRIPLAGPYAPRAQLVRFPDGRLLWRIRLWEYDRPVVHVVGTDVLRTFARINGLSRLRAEIDLAVEAACAGGRP